MIVVPLDRLDLAENLRTSLGSLARSLRSELTLVHVLPDPFASPYTPSEFAVLTQTARVTERLEKLAAQLQIDGMPVHAVVRVGVVQAEVVTQVARSHAELIVLPTHRPRAYHWINREGGGEHADLLDHSPVPILMVQENTPPVTDLHRILVPLDGSPAGDAILPAVAKLAATVDARVVLLHVLGSHEHESAHAAEQHLRTRVEELRRAGCSTVCDIVRGSDVGTAITERAEAMQADLIAMASRPREFHAGLTLGRVVESVRRGASVPLLVKNPRF